MTDAGSKEIYFLIKFYLILGVNYIFIGLLIKKCFYWSIRFLFSY